MLEGAWDRLTDTFVGGLDRRIDAEFREREPVRDPAANQSVTNDPAQPPVVSGRANGPTVAGISAVWLIGGALVATAAIILILRR